MWLFSLTFGHLAFIRKKTCYCIENNCTTFECILLTWLGWFPSHMNNMYQFICTSIYTKEGTNLLFYWNPLISIFRNISFLTKQYPERTHLQLEPVLWKGIYCCFEGIYIPDNFIWLGLKSNYSLNTVFVQEQPFRVCNMSVDGSKQAPLHKAISHKICVLTISVNKLTGYIC